MSNHPTPTARTRGILDLIAVFKFVKAGALIVAGLGGIGLLNANIEQRAESWLEYLAIGHAPKLLAELAAKLLPQLDAATPRHFIVLAVGAFGYASVFMVEGVGLIRARRWAEFLTIGVTISFLPFELYVLVDKQTWPRIITLVLNICVVAYLVWRVRADRVRDKLANSEMSSK
ncbi:MAG: DUF2127 domain-containing protein [Gemmatimonadaceae bacterium]